MEARLGCATHIGGRAEQQDAVGCFSDPARGIYFIALADGMGGHKHGARAAQIVIETAEMFWQTLNAGLPADPAAFLDDFTLQAHRSMQIQTEGQGHATMVALLVGRQHAWWAHAGDSRLYHFSPQRPITRTADHSLVQELFAAGGLKEHEMANHPEQHILFQGLGGNAPPEPCHDDVALDPQHRFVLCSDGFWGAVGPSEFARLFAADDLDSAAQAWARIAAQRNGASGDNIAIAILDTTV